MDNCSHDSFYGLGIAPGLLKLLDQEGFLEPTPIQHKAIPVAIEGKDIIGIAQTGTGKTLAYGIPMIQRLMQKKGRGLVLVPTRELAIQVDESIRTFACAFDIGTVVLIGGESSINQINKLKKNPRIVVATPGRLNDLINQRQARVNNVEILILDEADRMLDMGFKPQIEKIIRLLPSERQTMLFSATMPDTIVGMASKHMKLPVRTEIAPEGTAATGISQEIFVVSSYLKAKLLGELLNKYTGSVLLFTRTKRGASVVARIIRSMGHKSAEIHADRSLAQRKEALNGFKCGKYRILVATDIAARGIDVEGIEVVVNYDLPDDPENYVHRIGRTGRAGQVGHAISFAMPGQGGDVKNIEKIIRMNIPLSKHPVIPTEEFCSSLRKSSFSNQMNKNYHGSRSRYHAKRRRFH